MTAETAKILEETKQHLEEHQKNSDKLMDLIHEANLRKREQEQMHEQMKMLVENDDDKEAENVLFIIMFRKCSRKSWPKWNAKRWNSKSQLLAKRLESRCPNRRINPYKKGTKSKTCFKGFDYFMQHLYFCILLMIICDNMDGFNWIWTCVWTFLDWDC